MKSMTPYEVLQADSGFEVGDTVKVVRNWKEGEMGYEVGMGGVEVGIQAKIVEIDEFGFNLDNGFCTPFFAVEKVKIRAPRMEKPSEKELHAAYTELQKASGIKEGDYVKVLRTAKDFEMGWASVWVEFGMDKTVGNVYKVRGVDNLFGPNLVVGDCGYYFPFFVLEKVEKPFEPINVEGETGAVFATIHKDHVKLHVIDLTHSEARKLGRAVAKMAKR